MSTTSLSLFKAQLNLGPDDVVDDVLLQHKLDAAELWVVRHIGRAVRDGEYATVIEAVLQLAAHWFEQREAVTFGGSGAPIPFGVHDMLAPYRESVTGYVP